MKNSMFKKAKMLLKDLIKNNFTESVSRDFQDTVAFYLSDEQKTQLQASGFFKRNFLKYGWLIKSLFQKLTLGRQVLLIIGLALIFSHTLYGSNTVQIPNNSFIGALFILFVLMLELKDKLIAKSELNEGRAVQNALMPQDKPEINGWDIWYYSQPANEVGGDLVDYIKISERRFALILADISGKGLGAALLMAKLQSIIRTLAPDFISLQELIYKVNSVFCRDSLKKSFASLFYLELEPGKSKIKWVNAGHLPPIYLGGTQLKEFPKGSLAIGLSGKAHYKEETTIVNTGDTILIYSDGLTEALDNKNEFFEKHLNHTLQNIADLSAQQTGEKIVASVDAFTGSVKMHDDLSLIVLKKS